MYDLGVIVCISGNHHVDNPHISPIQSQVFVLPFGLRDMSTFPSVLRKRSPSVLVAIPSVQIHSYPRCYPQHRLTCLPQCCIILFTSRPGHSPFVNASVLQYISFYFVQKLEVTPLQALFNGNLIFFLTLVVRIQSPRRPVISTNSRFS